MATLEESFSLDLMPGTIPQSIHLSQNDVGWRYLKFSLHDRGKPFTVPSGTVAFFNGKKSDGKGFSYKMSVSDSTVSIAVQSQMTAAAGPVICEVSLQSGSEVIGSANLLLVVERCPLDGAHMSDSDMSAVNEAVARIGEAIAAAHTAIAKASEASSSAGRAASSAKAAAASATESANAATAAKGYRDQAAGYAGAASFSFMVDSEGYICLHYKEDTTA